MILHYKIYQKLRYIYYIVYYIIGKNINNIQSKSMHFLPEREILLLDIENRTPSKMKPGKVLSIYDFFQYNFFCLIVDALTQAIWSLAFSSSRCIRPYFPMGRSSSLTLR